MSSSPKQGAATTSEKAGFVSARFLTDFFAALSRRGIAATDLVGDLPIFVDAQGRVTRVVEWSHFVDFLRRLEHEVEGAEGLEKLGEMICEMKPARTIQSLAGIAASPFSLFRAASGWVLRRALPGVESTIERTSENDFLIRASVIAPLRTCPQLFHIATGGARALPRLLGMPDALVSTEMGEREATFQITVPPSRTLLARTRRFLQMLFSSGSVLRFLEDQQLELHTKHEELMRAYAELAKNELRYREMTDAAVDVLCEIDEDGQVSYVSGGVDDLLGYTPEQVTGSHFRLWIPTEFHAVATERFERLFTESAGQSAIRERLTLHAAGGRRIPVELVARTYCLSDRASEAERNEEGAATPPLDRTREWEGAWRFVATIRPLRQQPEPSAHSEIPHPEKVQPQQGVMNEQEVMNATPPLHSATHAHLNQAVEHALLSAASVRDANDWIDTRKLVDRAQFALQSQHTFSLRVDTLNAPAQIAGSEELLSACLRGLLGWGIARLGTRTTPHAFARSTPPEKLLLTIEVDSETTVRFSVGIDWPRTGTHEKVYGKRPQSNPGDLPFPITTCLTDAQDAALALGGRLLTRGTGSPAPQNQHDGEATSPLDLMLNPYATEQAVQIPQPSRPAPETQQETQA